MEPWQQEELRQLSYTAQRMRMPRCVCCGGHIFTERYLDLTPFGLHGFACEGCVDANMGYSFDLENSRR